MHEYSCRRLQPPTGDQKVQQTDDLRMEIISVATNRFLPIPSLMFLFKVFSLCLLSDSMDPNATAHSKQVSPPWWVLWGNKIQMLVAFFYKGVAKWHRQGQRRNLSSADSLCCLVCVPTVHRSDLRAQNLSSKGCSGYWVRHVWRNHSCVADVNDDTGSSVQCVTQFGQI